MEEPWPRVVNDEANGDIVTSTGTSIDNIPLGLKDAELSEKLFDKAVNPPGSHSC
jgi:hypothetical protein